MEGDFWPQNREELLNGWWLYVIFQSFWAIFGNISEIATHLSRMSWILRGPRGEIQWQKVGIMFPGGECSFCKFHLLVATMSVYIYIYIYMCINKISVIRFL